MSSSPAPVGSRPATLIVLDPAGNRARVRIRPLPFGIGRQSDNQLALRDSRISRVHARVVLDDGKYVIEDLRSRHGLFVNGVRVSSHVLNSADRIDFGIEDSYRLIFTLEESEVSRLAEQVSGSIPPGTATANLTRLRSLIEVARALETSISTDDVLAALIDAALAVTGAERGFLLLRDGDQLGVRVARDGAGTTLEASELRVPRGLIMHALRQRRELLSMNFEPGAESAMSRTVADLELRSVICVPLVRVQAGASQETAILSGIAETQGVLYMDSRMGRADLSAANRELLQTLALEASTILENARLLEGERARQRMEEELKVARSIQENLLPRRLPDSGWFRAAGRSLPSHQVGGDYFEIASVASDCWSIVMADVSGKGVSSALLAALLQGSLLAGPRDPDGSARMMARINRFLIERTEGEKYATLFYGAVNESGLLNWINAGHCAPLLLRRGERLRALDSNALPVGLLEEAEYTAETVQLQPGDRLVIYTDGVSEAQNADGAFFGDQRIRGLLREHETADYAAIFRALDDELAAFTSGAVQKDDITLLVVQYGEAP
jgi:serine phosphatase RsbU (regulator of sigma subunit)/pSer/pThr/pTyr-binding forkhead associated (FHA) protein